MDRYDLMILGAGAAGMAAAEFAASLDLRVAIVERNRLGGAALWSSDVPSKALLASAKAAHRMRHADELGLESAAKPIDTARVWARIRRIQHEIARAQDSPERLRQDLGVELFFGAAHVSSATTVDVAGETHDTRYILVATGSRPAVPLIPGLDDIGYITSETLWELDRAPESVVILGGGSVGVEMAQSLARLDVATTLLVGEPAILPGEEPALVERLEAQLRADGVMLHTGVEVDRVEVAADGVKVLLGSEADAPASWRGREIMIATGRRPNVEGLGLSELKIEIGARGIAVDLRQRTSVANIYAAGDVAGRWFYTHSAAYEAVRAVRNMFFPGRSRSSYDVPWCVFTDPELAHAGLTADEARAAHGDANVEVLVEDLQSSGRARAEGVGAGAIELVVVKGRVVGGHVLAPAAGEIIGELALAIDQGMRLADLGNVLHVHPTVGEGIQRLAVRASTAKAGRLGFLVR
jgi:pyruvate/2-oxoglutarate dehydrogenase complex dihydrolipoamide dehydrogenase (E3) component